MSNSLNKKQVAVILLIFLCLVLLGITALYFWGVRPFTAELQESNQVDSQQSILDTMENRSFVSQVVQFNDGGKLLELTGQLTKSPYLAGSVVMAEMTLDDSGTPIIITLNLGTSKDTINLGVRTSQETMFSSVSTQELLEKSFNTETVSVRIESIPESSVTPVEVVNQMNQNFEQALESLSGPFDGSSPVEIRPTVFIVYE